MKFNLNLNIVAAVTVTLLGAAVYYKYTTPVEEIKTDTDKTKIDELVQGEAVEGVTRCPLVKKVAVGKDPTLFE